jgi:hypothetical protein
MPLLGCGAVYILCDPTFRRNVSLTSLGCSHLLTLVPRSRIILPLICRRYVPRNVGSHKIYMASHPRRRRSSVSCDFNVYYKGIAHHSLYYVIYSPFSESDVRAAAHQLRQDKNQDMRQKKEKLVSAS